MWLSQDHSTGKSLGDSLASQSTALVLSWWSADDSGSLETRPPPGLWCPFQGTHECLASGSPFWSDDALERKLSTSSVLGHKVPAPSFPQAPFCQSLSTLLSSKPCSLKALHFYLATSSLTHTISVHELHKAASITLTDFTFWNQLQLSTIIQIKSKPFMNHNQAHTFAHTCFMSKDTEE